MPLNIHPYLLCKTRIIFYLFHNFLIHTTGIYQPLLMGPIKATFPMEK